MQLVPKHHYEGYVRRNSVLQQKTGVLESMALTRSYLSQQIEDTIGVIPQLP